MNAGTVGIAAAGERLTSSEPDKTVTSLQLTSSTLDTTAPAPPNTYVTMKDAALTKSAVVAVPECPQPSPVSKEEPKTENAPANIYEERVRTWGRTLQQASVVSIVLLPCEAFITIGPGNVASRLGCVRGYLLRRDRGPVHLRCPPACAQNAGPDRKGGSPRENPYHRVAIGNRSILYKRGDRMEAASGGPFADPLGMSHCRGHLRVHRGPGPKVVLRRRTDDAHEIPGRGVRAGDSAARHNGIAPLLRCQGPLRDSG